jgi:hypothetical protein
MGYGCVVLQLVCIECVERATDLSTASDEGVQDIQTRAHVLRDAGDAGPIKLEPGFVHRTRAQDDRVADLDSLIIAVIVSTGRDQIKAANPGMLDVRIREGIADGNSALVGNRRED